MSDPSNFTQSQSHGLFWDSEIREKIFLLPPCINDCEKFDIPCSKNRFDSKENISIKTSGNNTIDCGDILRFYSRDVEDNKITMILVKYKQINNTKQINEILEIDYSDEFKDILFGSVTKDVLENYVQFVKNIPFGNACNEIKNTYKKLKKEIQEKYNMQINISPKVDSKNQRRVQCSIPNFDKLLVKYPKFLISKTCGSLIRGIVITPIIESVKRVRNKKVKMKETVNNNNNNNNNNQEIMIIKDSISV